MDLNPAIGETAPHTCRRSW